MGSPKDYLEIMRPMNSVMLGFAIIVGAFITGGTIILQNLADLVFAFLTGFTMSGAAMTINDYFDREIDSVNEPQRPIPSGRITPSSAVVFTAILSVIGLASSYFVSFEALLIAVLAWIVMMAYSMWGKSTGFLGNLMVSFSVALPFIYGGFMSGSLAAAISFSGIAFLSNTGREIAKGIVDVDGDEEAGVNTLAVLKGEKSAGTIASLFLISAVLVSVYPVLAGLVSFWYIPPVAVTDLGLLASSIQLLKDPSRETSRSVKNRILNLMLIGLIGFAAGSLL